MYRMYRMENSRGLLLLIIPLLFFLIVIVYRARKNHVEKEILPLWKTPATAATETPATATETPVTPVSFDDSGDSDRDSGDSDHSGHDADHSVLSMDDSDHDSFCSKKEPTFLSPTEFGRYLLERQEQKKKMRLKEREIIEIWEEVEFRTWLNA